MKNLALFWVIISALHLNATTNNMYYRYITKMDVSYIGNNQPTNAKAGEVWVSKIEEQYKTNYIVKKYVDNSWINIKTIPVYKESANAKVKKNILENYKSDKDKKDGN